MPRLASISLCIAIATLAVYAQTSSHGFISLDDKVYVLENEALQGGLSRDGLVWAFWNDAYAGNWHPLTWLSHMVDIELFGLDRPGAHHAVSVLLHVLSGLLLLALLARATRDLWPSAVVAALFALHPMHVESVAWIAERKDVLAGLFWMTTLWSYVRYTETRSSAWYVAAAAAFGLGLCAKPSVVTLPFVLLLLDYWPLRRVALGGVSASEGLFAPSRLIVEKLPFFAMTLAGSVITLVSQEAAMGMRVPAAVRMGNALVAYAAYVGKLAWPTDLAVYYPHPGGAGQEPLAPATIAFSLAFVSLATAGAWIAAARGKRYVAVGWLWFLGTLVPMIGWVQVGGAAMADRYTYLPAIGLFIVVAWGGRDLARAGGLPAKAVGAVTAAIVVLYAVAAHRQVALWADDYSLFSHTAAVTRNNVVALRLLGVAHANREELEAAERNLRLAAEIDPWEVDSREFLGRILVRGDEPAEAVVVLEEAVAIEPEDPTLRLVLARAYAASGRPELAAEHAEQVLALDADAELRLKAHKILGAEYEALGRASRAVTHYEEVLRQRPQSSLALDRLGWIYATHPALGRTELALALATRACEITRYSEWRPLDSLAAALAASGDLAGAEARAGQALALLGPDREAVRAEVAARLAMYRRGEAYVEPGAR